MAEPIREAATRLQSTDREYWFAIDHAPEAAKDARLCADYILATVPADSDEDNETPLSILECLIDDLQVHDSLGVPGSGFTTCTACRGGSYPGHPYRHETNCPVQVAQEKLDALNIPIDPKGGM